MEADDLDYDLPADAIAQVPAEPRDSARLLDATGSSGPPSHRHLRDLPELVGPGDVIVLNDTRVLAARMRLHKPTGGAVEVLLLAPRPAFPGEWEALVGSAHHVRPGTELEATGMSVSIGDELGDGRRLVRLDPADGVTEQEAIAANGEIPLPPYIHQPLADPDRYQTVYSRPAEQARSVAAPTAGLHLTAAVLQRCVDRGATVHAVELEVGLGTFKPITAALVEDHHMHAERYRVAPEVLLACEAAARVWAVGTTVVRALESAAATGRDHGSTDLFIRPGFRFAVVDRLLTNFHVPRSSLLAMVEAFAGRRWRDLYGVALADGYRFLSFGDAMLLDRAVPAAP